MANSDVTRTPPTNATEPSPKSVLEAFLDRPSILHRLICEGDIAAVRDILVKAASQGNSKALCSLLEAQNTDGLTALHLASRRGSAEMVEAILACKEVNVDIFDRDGNPPIFFALAAGSHECVRALIRRSANVHFRLKEGSGPTLAHFCAFNGYPDCMRVRSSFWCFLFIFFFFKNSLLGG
jgi:E3 ubiquitin-protein ligase KEG